MRLCGKSFRAGQATDGNMAHVHCMLDTKATNTHTSCVILIAFLLLQWLHERASTLRCTHIACLFIFPLNRENFEKQSPLSNK